MWRCRRHWRLLASLQLAVCVSARYGGAQQVSPVGPRPVPVRATIRPVPLPDLPIPEAPASLRLADPASDRAGLRRAALTGAVLGAVLGLVVVGLPCGGIVSCGDADAPLPLIGGAVGALGGALIGAYAWTVPRAPRPAARRDPGRSP